MIVAGIDIGSLTAKSVIMSDGQVLSWSIIPTGIDSEQTARLVMDETLKSGGFQLDDMDYIVATGYGRVNVPFARKSITEISCHAKASVWLFPEVRTILDMGGQDCKAIKCDKQGKVTYFMMNDKCAAGTGRYLERIAAALEVALADIGDRSLKTTGEATTISSYCAVFAESDVLMLLRQGTDINSILAGASDAIVSRIMSLLDMVRVEPEFSISGGVAKNAGVVHRLEERLGLKAHIAAEPQIVGCLGAALFANEEVSP